MTYEAFVDIFRTAAQGFVGPPNVAFHYDYVWFNNAQAQNNYPAMLFECSPDFEFKGQQQNGNPGLQTISGKLFFYDTYWEAEKIADGIGTEAAYRKQSRLNDIAITILGDINLGLEAAGVQRVKWGKGFMAKDVHNPRLVQITIDFQATLRVDCKI